MLETMDIDYIVNNLHYNLFDFDYYFVSITYRGVPFTKEALQNEFLERFKYYQIGYSTLDEFSWRLKNVWLENIDELNMKVNALSQIDLETPEGLYLYSVHEGESKINTMGDNRYSNTPNQKILGFTDTDGYLTDRTLNKGEGKNEYVDKEAKNFVKTYGEIKKYLKNPLYEFFNKFYSLFITDVILNNMYIK